MKTKVAAYADVRRKKRRRKTVELEKEMRTYKKLFGAIVFVVSTVVCVTSHAASVTFDSMTNRITGFQGLVVDDIRYDAVLVEGTCADVFGVCTQSNQFDFADLTTASGAASAILSALTQLTTPPTGPTDFFGCTATTFCDLIIPWSLSGQIPPVLNHASLLVSTLNMPLLSVAAAGFGGSGFGISANTDTGRASRAVYAKFSVVPLPAAAWLFISGLVGLFGVRYKNKHRTK